MADAKIALVTGASRGIGASTAERLAVAGYHVLLVARTKAGLMEVEDRIHAAGGSASIVPLDLSKDLEIDGLASVVAQRWGRLDVLVLNAAVLGRLTPLGHAEPGEFESVLRLNLLAQWRLLRNFDAMLRRARGTVVALTSSVGSTPRPYWGAYSISKAGLENMAAVYAAETQALGLSVIIADPGRTRTAMRARAYPGEDPQSLKAPDVVAEALAEAIGAAEPGLRRIRIRDTGEISAD